MTLKTLQTLSKIGKVFSIIVFIFCIIGAVGCVLGIIGLAFIPEGFKIGDVTIKGLVEKGDLNTQTCYAAMACGIIMCAAEAVLAKFAERYFKNEIKAGTPFTFDGAKELTRLGILAICIPIGASILAGICYGIFKVIMKDVAELPFHDGGSVGLGVMMLVAGLLCKLGAESAEKQKEID
ncbi:MAG: hypothetical protein II117_03355 [Clostridia bacterium]|nr:hypothetical protein [Clostridia bacterium]